MTDGVLIRYPTLASYAAQFGEGALKDESRAVLAELADWRALTDAAADIIANQRGDENEMERWLARYRKAREQ